MTNGSTGARIPTEAEIAAVQRWEYDSLKKFFTSMAGADATDTLWQSVEQIVLASSPREVFAALKAHPALLTERGDAAMKLTELFVTATEMPIAQRILADRHAWIQRMHALNDA